MNDLTNKNIIQFNKSGVNYIQFRSLLNLGIQHAYSLKSDNLDFGHTDNNLQGEKNSYKLLCNAIGLDSTNLTKPNQTHTNVVERIDKVYSPEELRDIDGLVTNKKNIVLATTNADCILYLLYDKKNKVIGNVHSGWRGSYQRIIENAIDKMIMDFGSDPKDIIVCICPSIRKCCFEVGKDVKDMFLDRFSFLDNINEFIFSANNNDKFFIDTVGINNSLLINKGILKENIFDSGVCSVCNNDIVHSYRSEGKDFKRATAIISL